MGETLVFELDLDDGRRVRPDQEEGKASAQPRTQNNKLSSLIRMWEKRQERGVADLVGRTLKCEGVQL